MLKNWGLLSYNTILENVDCFQWWHLPSVDDGAMIRCGPLSPSSSKWARKEMDWIVFPRPWKCNLAELVS